MKKLTFAVEKLTFAVEKLTFAVEKLTFAVEKLTFAMPLWATLSSSISDFRLDIHAREFWKRKRSAFFDGS